MPGRGTLTGRNIVAVKSHNLSTILLTLLSREPISRASLAQLTGLSSTAVTNLVAELVDEGIVMEDGPEEIADRRGAGRRRTALRLVPSARHAVAVHIDVGRVRVAVSDLRAQLLVSRSLTHPLDSPPMAVLNQTAGLVEEVLAESGVDRQHLVGMGVGASGLVDPHDGVNVLAPNLGWREVPIGQWFSERLGLPVCVDNNVRAMALGEALFGAGQNAHILAFVYARMGVGAGLVVDGHLYRGSGAGAGEIGHVTILPEGGERCRCGNSGCLETLVSEPAILRLAEELAAQDPQGVLGMHLARGEGSSIESVFAAARSGDAATQALLQSQAYYMGIALANLVNVFNPELILLGGILAQGADLMLPMIDDTVRQRAFAGLGERVRIQTTSFARQAGLVGAAALALDAFFYRRSEPISR